MFKDTNNEPLRKLLPYDGSKLADLTCMYEVVSLAECSAVHERGALCTNTVGVADVMLRSSLSFPGLLRGWVELLESLTRRNSLSGKSSHGLIWTTLIS